MSSFPSLLSFLPSSPPRTCCRSRTSSLTTASCASPPAPRPPSPARNSRVKVRVRGGGEAGRG
eukprot:747722-Hanusia_phi.AAC.1